MRDRTFTDEEVAQVCHAANQRLQKILAQPVSPDWEEESDHTRESAIEGVRRAREGTTPRQNHQDWVKFKLTAGWRYGPFKDPVAKTHPDIVDYDELPGAERTKDKLFLFNVAALTV